MADGLRVALITEATYPHFFGGVSVWCDHLTRGLPDTEFDVYAICDDSSRRPVWASPANVKSLALIPIAVPGRRGSRHQSVAARDLFATRFEEFCLTLFATEADGPAMVAALEGMREAFAAIPPAVGLRMHSSVTTLSSVWNRFSLDDRITSTNPPTLSDVVEALAMFDPLLRPLDYTPAPCDVVHSTANGLSMLLAFTAKWEQGVPLVLTEHGVYLRERYLADPPVGETRNLSALRMRFFRNLNAAGFAMADVLSPVSEFNARWEVQTGAKRDKIRVIHNGVDPDRFDVVNAPDGPSTISFIGRIDPLKDLETLVNAFAIVAHQVPGARLRIFGPVPPGNEAYAARIAALVDTLGLAESVTFEGRLSDPRLAYRAGHVVALSSISEGLPYTLIEAMMSGCATVSTDVGGISEVTGDAGLLVPARDPEAFAAACIELLTKPQKRQRMARDARTRAMHYFTIGQFVGAYDGLYRETVDADWEGFGSQPVEASQKAV